MELIDFIFDFMETTSEEGLGFAIIMFSAAFFIAGLWYLFHLKSNGVSILDEARLILVVCIITGIVSIGGGFIHYSNVDRSQTMIISSPKVEYNEIEDCYELVGKSNGKTYHMDINDELIKKINPEKQFLFVTYEGKDNLYVVDVSEISDTWN